MTCCSCYDDEPIQLETTVAAVPPGKHYYELLAKLTNEAIERGDLEAVEDLKELDKRVSEDRQRILAIP